MKSQLKHAGFGLLLLSALNSQLSTVLAQGSLTPPGAPAPTMKSLDQIEARTPIDAAHTPGDANNQFIISAPGSYYLTGNITGVSNLNCIEINVDNVTLDLNGFALIGVSNSIWGIWVAAPHKNLRVHNGSVQNWGGSGMYCWLASNSQFDHLRASLNYGTGIYGGTRSIFTACTAETNLIGISTDGESTLTGCTAANNSNYGFTAGNYSTVTACTATANGSGGFNLQNNSTVIACTACGNKGGGILPGDACTVKDCTVNYNVGSGISGLGSLVIVNCTVNHNSGDGIACNSDSLINGNTASYNLNGIYVNNGGSLNRIDGNTANHNSQVGIRWVNDFVIRNNAFLNGSANYSPAVGTGNTGPLNAAGNSTSPWANF